MSIVLPEPHAATVRQRAAELGMTPLDYLVRLVEHDAVDALGLNAEEHERLAQLIDEGLASGEPIAPGPDYKEEIFRRAREIVERGD